MIHTDIFKLSTSVCHNKCRLMGCSLSALECGSNGSFIINTQKKHLRGNEQHHIYFRKSYTQHTIHSIMEDQTGPGGRSWSCNMVTQCQCKDTCNDSFSFIGDLTVMSVISEFHKTGVSCLCQWYHWYVGQAGGGCPHHIHDRPPFNDSPHNGCHAQHTGAFQSSNVWEDCRNFTNCHSAAMTISRLKHDAFSAL